MIIIDVNLLLYSVESTGQEYPAASVWLNEVLSGEEAIGLPWISLWGFLRIGTNPRAWPKPMTTSQAFTFIHEWLGRKNVIPVEPGLHYAQTLEQLLSEHKIIGPRITDVALAALAIENGATLASTDRDFARFKELRWINPLD